MSKPAQKFSRRSLVTFRARLSLQEQALFARRLSLLVKAGVPLLESLSILERHATSSANRRMFEHISKDVANGQFLSKSLSRFKKVFGEFAINIIRVGETSGTLPENLKYLSDELDKRRKLRQKLIGALVYPLVIMISAFSVSGLMTVYLFPKLMPVFKSLNVDLPFMTLVLIAISNFLLSYWLFLVLALVVLVIVFIFLMRLPRFHYAMNTVSLKIPIVGLLLKNYHIVNLCRTLGILFKSQVQILEAITVTADTSPNLVYRKELQRLHRAITKGGTISKHFEKHPKLFPGMLTQMIAIGEKTGNLSDTLIYLAEIYEQEFEEQTSRLSSVVEPAMMLMMGLLVGFVAVSIITPIYEVTQHLNPK